MIDFKTAWMRVKGRWGALRHVPTLFLSGAMPGTQGNECALASFAQWCEAHQGAVCRVGLSGSWLLNCVPGQELDAQEARQQAMQQWAHYLDTDEASLHRDWVLREVRFAGVGLVSGAPRVLVEGMRAQAMAHGVSLDWVGPWWAHGVQAWLSGLQPVAQGRQKVHTLHLVEPGLVTHVQASVAGDAPAGLHRIWADRSLPTSMDEASSVVSLPVPDQDANKVWDAPSLQTVLTGQDACWREAA